MNQIKILIIDDDIIISEVLKTALGMDYEINNCCSGEKVLVF